MDEQKPGQVVTPGAQPAPTPPAAPAPPTTSSQQPNINSTFTTEPVLSAEDAAKYQTPAQFAEQPQEYQNQEDAITWSASEYIAHHKSGGWYGLFALIALAILVAIYFITGGDILSVVVVAIVGIVFVMYAGRTPKEQQYSISDQGITVGSKTYSFHDFKSFSIIDEGAFSSISFMPLKRFMPVISIYYAPEHENEIVDALSVHLPFDQREADAIDRLMKKIRF